VSLLLKHVILGSGRSFMKSANNDLETAASQSLLSEGNATNLKCTNGHSWCSKISISVVYVSEYQALNWEKVCYQVCV
jgi:hypothetical protein